MRAFCVPVVKLKASIGFHAIALVIICIITLRIGVRSLTSYSTIFRSLAALASTLLSIGLNLAVVIVSAPHENEWTGSDRFSS